MVGNVFGVAPLQYVVEKLNVGVILVTTEMAKLEDTPNPQLFCPLTCIFPELAAV